MKSGLERFACPVIGDLPVKSQSHLLRILEPHWIDTPPTMADLRARLAMILDHATAKGHRQGDTPAQLKRLAFLLPNVQRKVRVALPSKEVPALMIHDLARQAACGR